MKRVAVFGNAGGGKSTLAKRLADLTRLPLYPLDMIQFRAGGGRVPHEQYLKAHADLLRQDEWIIDGFGCVASAWERFSEADTLVYVDLPLTTQLLVGDKAPDQRPVRNTGGLAGKQSDVAQHDGQLQGGLALPPPTDAQVQAACR
jgi:shikimate kinase